MPKYNFEIEISAGNEPEAETKMKAVVTLIKNLSAKEIEKLADIIQNDPKTTALAKQFLGF